jgi:hypothetical protein
LERAVVLAKVTDEGLMFHGVDASITSNADYGQSRRLAADLWSDFPSLDGLAYRSRQNNVEICYGFFDRVATSTITSMHPHLFRDERARVNELVSLHGAVLDESAHP